MVRLKQPIDNPPLHAGARLPPRKIDQAMRIPTAAGAATKPKIDTDHGARVANALVQLRGAVRAVLAHKGVALVDAGRARRRACLPRVEVEGRPPHGEGVGAAAVLRLVGGDGAAEPHRSDVAPWGLSQRVRFGGFELLPGGVQGQVTSEVTSIVKCILISTDAWCKLNLF